MKHQRATSAALAAVMTTLLSTAAISPALAADKEKCYGIAKAGQNDCANLAGTHSCAGQSTIDNDIGEWKLVDEGTCETLGGHYKAAATEIWNAQK